MEYVLFFAVGTTISWLLLLIIVPIAQRLADFSLPPWPETLWKLAVVASVGNVVAIVLDPINWFVSLIAGAIVFFVLMVKWFSVDMFGAIVIIVVSWVLRTWLSSLIMALIGPME
ncbi:MAG: hypothetical protein HQ546_07880 [Planctomycetes bacterium]|nr:hypothetical protein [Planctomycetota bacterium]